MPRYLLFVILILSCSAPTREDASIDGSSVPVIDVTVFKSEYGGYGYDLSVNSKLFVHQPNIPAIAGNKGFPSKQCAHRVASLVIQKIKKNQIPPTLTFDEVIAAMQKPTTD
jgi:hypothetical protein